MKCFLPRFPNSRKGVLYTSSIAPLIILGAMRCISAPPSLIACSILCLASLLMSAVALLIMPGATLPTWLTVSLPAYAKS